MNKKVIDAFHNHLDNCSQCRNNPFDLCPTGAKLIVETQKPTGRFSSTSPNFSGNFPPKEKNHEHQPQHG